MTQGPLHRYLELIRETKSRFSHAIPTQDEVDALCAAWSWAEDPAEREQLAVCRLDGRLTGAFAPRWLAHLLGIPHATAHVGLFTPTGLVVLQLRSPRKAQFPNAWDMAVTGHVALPAGAPRVLASISDAAERELEEELGLPASRLGDWMEAGRLECVGAPRVSRGEDERALRPWCDVEVRQLFAGVLTPQGVANLSYQEDELSGVLLCRPSDGLTLLSGGNAAAGALDSLRDLLGWYSSRG